MINKILKARNKFMGVGILNLLYLELCLKTVQNFIGNLFLKPMFVK